MVKGSSLLTCSFSIKRVSAKAREAPALVGSYLACCNRMALVTPDFDGQESVSS